MSRIILEVNKISKSFKQPGKKKPPKFYPSTSKQKSDKKIGLYPSRIILTNYGAKERILHANNGLSKLVVLNDLCLNVAEGTLVAITGASGSGKSTLLHLIGNLDQPDNGEVFFKGENIYKFDEKRKAEYRNKNVGFLYQFHYLMPELNVIENIVFPSLMRNFEKEESFIKGEKLLTDVGLKEKLYYMPYQLSGGERQRVAIARCLINTPDILLIDEPTGNLDWSTGERVFGVLRELIKNKNLTAIIVTHNEQLSRMVDKSYHLLSGKLV